MHRSRKLMTNTKLDIYRNHGEDSKVSRMLNDGAASLFQHRIK